MRSVEVTQGQVRPGEVRRCQEMSSEVRSVEVRYPNNGGGTQGDYDGRGQQTASPMLTAIMSGGVGICGRELSTHNTSTHQLPRTGQPQLKLASLANHSRASCQHGGRAHLEKSAWGQGSLGKVSMGS